MSDIKVELVTPEALLFSEDAEMVVLPGQEGDFGVLSSHAPMVSSLRAGAISIGKAGGEKNRVFVSGGFAEVTGERCTILAEDAIDMNGLTLDKAKDGLREAEDALKYAPDSEDKRPLKRKRKLAAALVETLERDA